MITAAKVKEYIWCDGDIDGYSRSGRADGGIINDDEWRYIDQVLAKITLIRNGLASDDFQAIHEEDKKQFDSQESYELLKEYEAKG